MSRKPWLCLALATVFLAAGRGTAAASPQLVSSSPTPAEHATFTGVCITPAVICGGPEVIRNIGEKVGDAAADAVGSGATVIANSAMGRVVAWAADGAAWLVGEVVKAVERSSRPQLKDAWFQRRYDGMVQIAGLFAALFLMLAVGQAILAQDLSRLLRAALVRLPCALLLTFAAVTLVEIELRVTDEMTAWVLHGSGDDMREAFRALASVFAATSGSPLAPFVLFISATITSLIALLVWLELVMREAAVYVAVIFLPLTLAAGIWEQTAHWSRRLAEWLLAIIHAKFTIAVAFALAASAITEAPGDGGGLTAVLAGCSVLLLAALTPWALLRILPFAESAAARGLTPRHVTGAVMAAPGAMTATFAARQLAVRNFGSAGHQMAGAVASPPAQTPPPQPRPADEGLTDLPQLPTERPLGRSRERSR
jgi:hypothetical protein